MTLWSRTWLSVSASVVLATAALAACAGESDATAGASPAERTATAERTDARGAAAGDEDAEPSPEPPSVQRILVHVEHLAGELGPRVAGTATERTAAGYIADVLEASGYTTTIETFTFRATYDESRALLPGDEQIDAFMLAGSASGNVYGRVVLGGLGRAEDLEGLRLRGRVLIVDRGQIPFAEKVRNAEAAGAAAIVIVNNRPGRYGGTLGDLSASIPVVGVAQEDRPLLHELAESRNAMLTVIAQGGRKEHDSQNVVGRHGDRCDAYIGAHYDSVPESPGANDNASGVGLMLELARAHHTEGLCAIAFGAEEEGLWGSQAFVRTESTTDAVFMLNFDMVGKVTRPIIVGDDGLTTTIMELLEDVPDSPIRPGSFPPFAASDHVSFTAVGVPAVTIHSGDDEHLHSPQDDLDNVDERSLAVMLETSEVALTGLLELHGLAEAK